MNRQGRVKQLCVAALAMAVLGTGAIGLTRGATAQDATPVTSTTTATVTVNGTGSVTVTPDAASISVGVNVVNANLSEAQAAATSQMTAVIDTLKAAGIDEKDIQTSNYSVYIMQNYDNNGFPAEITGYQVNNQVNVTVRDLDAIGEILDDVVAAGANSIYGINFMVTDVEAAASQARASAVANANAKAEELATATGATLGRIISITENYSPSTMPEMFEGAGGAAMDSAKSSVPFQAGGTIVQVDVTITYELIQ
jgi:uncharacterized protein YggE